MKSPKTPKFWLFLALAMALGGVLSAIAFFLVVWPPGALLVLTAIFFVAAGFIDMPRPPKTPR